MNFLYNATNNFKGFYDNGFTPEKIDLKDLLILSYLNYWQGRKGTKKKDSHFWVNRKSMLENLPYLGISHVNVLTRRFSKLETLGLITRSYNAENGAVFILLTDRCLDCISGQKVMENPEDSDFAPPPNSKVAPPPNSRVSHPQTLEFDYYIDQEHIDHKKLKQKEKHAMLVTLWGSKAEAETSFDIFREVCKTDEDFENILKSAEWYVSTQPEYKYKKRLGRWLKNKEFVDIISGLKEGSNGNKCSRCVYRCNENCTEEKRKLNLFGENCGSWIQGEPEDKVN